MSKPRVVEEILTCFGALPDPRHDRGVRHLLHDLLVIVLLAEMCGAEDAEDIEEWARVNEDWLRGFLELPHGIPSADTYLRVMQALEPRAFRQSFAEWVNRLRSASGSTTVGGHVAVDGKTLRGSFDTASGTSAIHMVSAWLAGCGLVLGQTKTNTKSNEITAIPELLAMLDLREVTVTIDAMGCQRAIAAQIADAGGYYVLAVKDNQPTLHRNVQEFFADARKERRSLEDGPRPELDHTEETDAGHGRIETRACWVSPDLSFVEDAAKWKNLRAVGVVEATRTEVLSGKTSCEPRYYITNLPDVSAERLNALVRGHWGIENRLHWVLDVTFGEDASRVRTRNAAENFATIRHMAMNLLREAPGKKSIKTRRKRCGWDRGFLLAVLGFQGAYTPPAPRRRPSVKE
jgi:predicted transposase YbfD/YdcC